MISPYSLKEMMKHMENQKHHIQDLAQQRKTGLWQRFQVSKLSYEMEQLDVSSSPLKVSTII